jgi:hypothetical protein
MLFKVIFLCDDTTGSGLATGEGAAYHLPTAARLVATGVCRIADDERARQQLEAAVKAYKRPALNKFWLLPCVTKRWPGWYK